VLPLRSILERRIKRSFQLDDRLDKFISYILITQEGLSDWQVLKTTSPLGSQAVQQVARLQLYTVAQHMQVVSVHCIGFVGRWVILVRSFTIAHVSLLVTTIAHLTAHVWIHAAKALRHERPHL
jgi:phage gp16-like protein